MRKMEAYTSREDLRKAVSLASSARSSVSSSSLSFSSSSFSSSSVLGLLSPPPLKVLVVAFFRFFVAIPTPTAFVALLLLLHAF